MTADPVLARLVEAPELPACFVRSVTELQPGCVLAFDPVEWADAVVLVRDGVVEVQLHSGVRRRFCARDVLWLAGLDVRGLHNPGPDVTALVAVRRAGGT